MNDKKTAVAGLALIALCIVLYELPGLVFKGSVAEVHSICSSGIGALAQGLSAKAQSGCQSASTWTTGLLLAGLTGVCMAAYGAWKLTRKS